MPISRSSIPGVIKISDDQIANINHEMEVFGKKNFIYQHIGMKKSCSMCDSYRSDDVVFPVGNVESKIMFVSDAVVLENMESKSPFTDGNNVIFQILLEKLNIKKDDVYMTSLYKCLQAADNEASKYVCAGNVLAIEIFKLRPRVVVGVGINVAKILFPIMGYDVDPSDTEAIRNKAHHLSINGHDFDYVQTYDTNMLVKDFEKLSGAFAGDIMNAMKVAAK